MPSAKKKPTDENLCKGIVNKLKTITKEPEKFLKAQPEKCNAIRELIKDTYKATTLQDRSNANCPHLLPDLIVDEMDEEQIWQQLELRNDFVLKQFVGDSAKLLALREQKLEIRLEGEEDDDEEDDKDDEESDQELGMDEDDDADLRAEEDDEEDDDEEDDELDEERNFGLEREKPKKLRSSIVDDKFFKLGEMEAFLEAEDAKEMKKAKGRPPIDDGIDYFADDLGGEGDDGDDEDENPNYSEFFMDEEDLEEQPKKVDTTKKKQKKQKDHFAEPGDDDVEDDDDDDDEDDDNEDATAEHKDSEETADKRALEPASDSDTDAHTDNDDDEADKPKSSFEQRELRLQQRIRQYEEEVLGEKPWQLKGEIQAGSRPQNSLLEEILEFESTVRPAPIITEETTRCLEDIIKQRIKDKAWDDVERTVRPTHTPQDYRKQLVLDQEKSKESLAQIYEKEYQKELDKADPSRLDDTVADEPKEHKEIKTLMNELFNSLDALFNYNFTPKAVMPEPKIITNTPAVSMEEVAPIAVSDAALLAPEEVYRGPKHEPVGKTERSRTDKNRERRKKKQKQRAIHKVLEERDLQRQRLGKPLSKKEESAKLMKSITKHRNVQKITESNDKGSLKSSKAFFSKLQDSTTTTAGKASAKDAAKKKNDAKTLSAKKLKL